MRVSAVETPTGGMPVIILREGIRENKGRDAQKNNITATKSSERL